MTKITLPAFNSLSKTVKGRHIYLEMNNDACLLDGLGTRETHSPAESVHVHAREHREQA
ncbi:hypothetical protein [Mucilaginibacter conchicola]|uniref:hypothetical protein n=1 Tax=Mucilaginibacter conchicola TaxID=2303333 RepID=UPI0013146C31|nr:hypothetical protein [Mucilaginibacter conchicola]